MTLSRRDVLKLTAAAAATPLVPGNPLQAGARKAPGAGRFFTEAEMALLDELTEMIIPADDHSGGARAARVALYIDTRLAEYDPSITPLREEREQWKAGLSVVDALSRGASGQAFLAATPAQRLALLERLAKDSPPGTEEKDRGTSSTPRPDELGPGRRFFARLKEWTAKGYYTSKVGLHDELEYKGNTLQGEFAGIDPATLKPVRPVED